MACCLLMIWVVLLSLVPGTSFSACQDFTYKKADESDHVFGRRNAARNIQVLYMFRGFAGVGSPAVISDDAGGRVLLPCSGLTSSAKEALATTPRADDGGLVFESIQNAWAFFDTRGFAYLNYGSLIKPTLAELKAALSFENWTPDIIENSVVKQRTRVVFRSPAGHVPKITVSQTHDDVLGDMTTPVRETEVAIERPDARGDWDFFVYDKDGKLSEFDEFPSGYKAVPTVCVSCHYDATKGRVSRIFVP